MAAYFGELATLVLYTLESVLQCRIVVVSRGHEAGIGIEIQEADKINSRFHE
jgi:hypothetical protein